MSHLTTPFEHACLRTVSNTGVVGEVNFSIFANTIAEVVAHVEDFIRSTKLVILLKVDWTDGRTEHFLWNDDLHEFTLL